MFKAFVRELKLDEAREFLQQMKTKSFRFDEYEHIEFLRRSMPKDLSNSWINPKNPANGADLISFIFYFCFGIDCAISSPFHFSPLCLLLQPKSCFPPKKYNFRTSKRGVIFRDLGTMNPRRDFRNNKVSLFDGIEEGGIRASASYSHEIDEHDNERAVEGLQDRVNLLKRLSGDINEEVETHNRMLDRMGNEMDSSRGILSGTMDKFKMVFETKSSRKMFTLVASFVVIFLIVYYLTR
ncbi:hypothetical protein Q3G72_003051 [Acer saccharum]|nr:hypothetical protein Q3G72_001869 [Acer saccharum]KAK1558501.1 hypothetical protein Q3G72_003051 [Acer saccharum]